MNFFFVCKTYIFIFIIYILYLHLKKPHNNIPQIITKPPKISSISSFLTNNQFEMIFDSINNISRTNNEVDSDIKQFLFESMEDKNFTFLVSKNFKIIQNCKKKLVNKNNHALNKYSGKKFKNSGVKSKSAKTKSQKISMESNEVTLESIPIGVKIDSIGKEGNEMVKYENIISFLTKLYDKKTNFYKSREDIHDLIHFLNPEKKFIYRISAFVILFLEELEKINDLPQKSKPKGLPMSEDFKYYGKLLNHILKYILYNLKIPENPYTVIIPHEYKFFDMRIFQIDLIMLNGFLSYLKFEENNYKKPFFFSKNICLNNSKFIVRLITLFFTDQRTNKDVKINFEKDVLGFAKSISQDNDVNHIFLKMNLPIDKFEQNVGCSILQNLSQVFTNRKYTTEESSSTICRNLNRYKNCSFESKIVFMPLIVISDVTLNENGALELQISGISTFKTIDNPHNLFNPIENQLLLEELNLF